MTTTDDLAPLLEIMSARIRRQVEARRELDRITRERLELQAALRRYGAAGPSIAEACGEDDAGRLEVSVRATVSERVSRELHRQTRLSRSRDPRYDINRHIVVARLTRWLAGNGSWIAATPGEAGPAHDGRGTTGKPHERPRRTGKDSPSQPPRRTKHRRRPDTLRPKSNVGQ
ncbi:hypothetical protein [Jiella pacifica]|uniref:Uncharacterized protein n=1 Tax=Jiella pacifica TaxID=2696469 RepID=A0A6N9T2Y0_9HYPH|nr:hypothetical protein [Jiella pacifica]NDW04396.1 hypothetical protein [Jiella pacifica]